MQGGILMRFATSQVTLAAAASWAARAAAPRPFLPALGGILAELGGDVLRLVATDLDRTTEATIEVDGDTDGTVLVPGQVFARVLAALPPGRVELAAQPGTLSVHGNPGRHELRLLDPGDFPSLPDPAEAQVGIVAGELLACGVDQVARAVAPDSRGLPVLTAVLAEASLQRLTLVACDSYRLAVRELDWSGPDQPTHALIPARALAEAAKAFAHQAEVLITLEAHQATFEAAGRRLTSRLIEGQFPDWPNLLPAPQTTAVADRTTLAAALKQVTPYADNGTPVRLAFSPGRLELHGDLTDVGRGSTAIQVNYDAAPATLAVNPAFLADALGAIDNPQAVIKLTGGPMRPLLLHGHDPVGYRYLLMPVHVPDLTATAPAA
jgi:DNA polymerase-3 subunit beta